MSGRVKSFEKVHYEFRPAKQVERRMLLDVLQRLMEVGFPVSSYQYTGMGSMWYIDFILLRRYLGITKMMNVERSHEHEKRVRFNKPYGDIEIFMGDVSDYIPEMSRDRKHILWLDFDGVLESSMLDAIVLATTQLSAGSIFLITVDVEPPGEPSDGPKQWSQHFKREAGDYLGNITKSRQFARSKLIEINAGIIENAIRHGLAGRSDVAFFPLVNFEYADGHRMLSVGGMIGTDQDGRRLDTIRTAQLPFLRDSIVKNPYEIKVPLLTRKERLHLDSEMPCRPSWRPRPFEMKPEDVLIYREIYPYFPAYTETLL